MISIGRLNDPPAPRFKPHPLVESIFQTKTYGGVHLGQPNAELNQAILTSALKHAVKLFMAPCIPVSTTIELATLGRQRLAPISCIGLFTSAKPIHSPDRGGSKLAMVWFQSDYGLPKSVCHHLRVAPSTPLFSPFTVLGIVATEDEKRIIAASLDGSDNSWRAKCCANYLEWIMLVAKGIAIATELEDLYEPLIMLIERDAAIELWKGEILADGNAFPGGTWLDRYDEPPRDISKRALDEADALDTRRPAFLPAKEPES